MALLQIFEAAGFASAQDATKVSVVLGGFKLLMTGKAKSRISAPQRHEQQPNVSPDVCCASAGVAVATVDKLGRRPLLLAGVGGLVLSLLALSSSQEFLHGSTATWVSVGGLLAYCACYQVYETDVCSSAGKRHSDSPSFWPLTKGMFCKWRCLPHLFHQPPVIC